MDILFKNVTAVTMEKDRPVIFNANVGIDNGRIAFVDQANSDQINSDQINSGQANSDQANSGKPNPTQAKRIVNGEGKVLIPGLYNCHAHTPMSLLRGFGNDLALEEWLFDRIFPAERKIKEIKGAVYIGAVLSIAEMIASGTIAFNDMYFGLQAIAQAVEETGVKANLSNAAISFEPEGYDYYKSSEYQETLHILENYHKTSYKTIDKTSDNTSGKTSDKTSHGRIKAEASLHCAYTTHPTAWRQVAEFAQKHNLTMHVHLSETIAEHNKSLEMFDLTPTAAFASHGVFDVPAIAAHGCWVTEEDIDILAQKGVTIAHNPVSNLKLASGIAPITQMQEKGINIALGTDGMASNNTHDLFEEIKLASILQKCTCENPMALPAFQVLEMATVNGAKGAGREGGLIREGYDADLVLLDFNSINQIPSFDPLINLAYSTTGNNVIMTLCQGRILYENGEFTTIDIEKIKSEAKKISENFI